MDISCGVNRALSLSLSGNLEATQTKEYLSSWMLAGRTGPSLYREWVALDTGVRFPDWGWVLPRKFLATRGRLPVGLGSLNEIPVPPPSLTETGQEFCFLREQEAAAVRCKETCVCSSQAC